MIIAPETVRHRFLVRPVTFLRSRGYAARVEALNGEVEVACRTRGAWLAFRQLVRRGSVFAPDAAPGPTGRTADAQRIRRDWLQLLRQLDRHGTLGTRLLLDGVVAAEVWPVRGGARETSRPTPRRAPVCLSRFAHLRRDGAEWVLESPLASDRVRCGPPMLTVLAALAQPMRITALARQTAMAPAALRALLALLDASGMLTAVRPDGRTAEDADPILEQWEFADLVMQGHHRVGRHDGVVGASYPFAGRVPAEPATIRLPARRRIRLPRPSLPDLLANDVGFTSVVEQRRSIREYGTRPVSIAQVGELLWRSDRVRNVYPPTPGRPYTVTDRPYASGGGAYPLELFLVVGRCKGLARGLYHYDPVSHALGALGAHRTTVECLLEDARQAQGRSGGAQVLLVFVARFRRLTWKYRSIALATILKDVGSLLQTLYLNATAMGLAPCGVGSGDATRLGQALGWRFEDASSVGEFMLGSAPD